MKIAAAGGGQVEGENGEAAVDPDRYSPFFYLWILCSIASSLYAYTWDIKMDWGLLDRSVNRIEITQIKHSIFIKLSFHQPQTKNYSIFYILTIAETQARTNSYVKKPSTRQRVTITLLL